MATTKPLTSETVTYQQLVELLAPFGFAVKDQQEKHCILQHEQEQQWRIVFPADKRFNKPAAAADLLSLRAHLEYWGLVEARTIDEMLEKLER